MKPALIYDEDDLRRVVRDELRSALDSREAPSSARVYLTTAQAAKRVGCNPQTLTRMAKRGEIPFQRLGRALRFRPEDLDAWLAKGKA